MKWFTRCFFIAIIVSFIFTVLIITLLDNSESEVSVEFINEKVYLNINVDEAETCVKLMQALDIKSIVVKDKLYSPTCSRINKNLIRITYSKDIDI